MHRDELNKLTVNFNNFLANRFSVDESAGAIPVEPSAPVAEQTKEISPEQSTAILTAVKEWWEMNDTMGFHGGGDQAFHDATEELIQQLQVIMSGKGGVQEVSAPKKSDIMSKKEIDAYKADHETGKKDSKGKPVYSQNWKKKK